MTQLEAVDGLCGVSCRLLELVRKQNAVIRQADIPDGLKDDLEAEMGGIEEQMDILGYRMRRI